MSATDLTIVAGAAEVMATVSVGVQGEELTTRDLKATCVHGRSPEPERAPGPLVREHHERPDRPSGHPVRSRQVCRERPVKAVGGVGAGRDNDRSDPEPDSEPVLCDQSDRGEQAPETAVTSCEPRPIDHDAHFVWGLTASGREHETRIEPERTQGVS